MTSKNVGQGLAELDSNSIFVDDVPQTILSIERNLKPSFPYTIEPGKTVTITVNYTITDNAAHDIKVILADGTIAESKQVPLVNSTPIPSSSPTVSPSPVPFPSLSSSPSPSPDPTTSLSPTSPSPTVSPSPLPSSSPSPSPDPTPSSSPTPSPSSSPTVRPSAAPSSSPSPSPDPTPSPSPTASPSPSPTVKPSPVPSSSPSPSPGPTPSPSPTASPSPHPSPSPITHGVISVVFDDGNQNVFDNAVPILEAHNAKSTFYVITDFIRDVSHDDTYMNVSELLALQDSGHEIESHSKSHPYFPSLSETAIRQQLSLSKQALQSYGINAKNFAFPYGGTNDTINAIALEYYRSARSGYQEPYLMPISYPQGNLTGFPGESNTQLLSKVDQTASSNKWTIIFFHNIVNNLSDIPESQRPYAMTTADFSNFIEYTLSKGITIMTVDQALNLRT